MRFTAFFALILVSLALLPGNAVLAKKAKPKVTYSDPIGYCKAVVTTSGDNDPRYTGPQEVDWITKAMIPVDDGYSGVMWRCDKGQVVACVYYTGTSSGLAECSPRSLDRTPDSDMIAWCRSNPNASIPLAVGYTRYSGYEWACKKGRPTIVGQYEALDAFGFWAGQYTPVKPPEGYGSIVPNGSSGRRRLYPTLDEFRANQATKNIFECSVTTSGGRARLRDGPLGEPIDFLNNYDIFTVTDAQTDANGELWYRALKINNDTGIDQKGWISASLTLCYLVYYD